MVFTRRYWCGKMGAQLLFGSRGRFFGLIPPSPSRNVRSKSSDSSKATGVPITFGHRSGPPGIGTVRGVSAGGDTGRWWVTSYQKPVVVGEPRVTRAASPGKESEGCEVELLV